MVSRVRKGKAYRASFQCSGRSATILEKYFASSASLDASVVESYNVGPLFNQILNKMFGTLRPVGQMPLITSGSETEGKFPIGSIVSVKDATRKPLSQKHATGKPPKLTLSRFSRQKFVVNRWSASGNVVARSCEEKDAEIVFRAADIHQDKTTWVVESDAGLPLDIIQGSYSEVVEILVLWAKSAVLDRPVEVGDVVHFESVLHPPSPRGSYVGKVTSFSKKDNCRIKLDSPKKLDVVVSPKKLDVLNFEAFDEFPAASFNYPFVMKLMPGEAVEVVEEHDLLNAVRDSVSARHLLVLKHVFSHHGHPTKLLKLAENRGWIVNFIRGRCFVRRRARNFKGTHSIFMEASVSSDCDPCSKIVSFISEAMDEHDLMQVRHTNSELQSITNIRSALKTHLSKKYSRHFSLIPKVYGKRGDHDYFKPCGWTRISKEVDGDQSEFRGMEIAYHGTTLHRAMLILAERFFLPRSREDVVHGQAYSKDTFSGYLSPSVEYAAHPVYANLARVDDNTFIQAVVEVRIKPGAFTSHRGTLRGPKHWDEDLRFDANFPTWDGLEWKVTEEDVLIVSGVLFRVLGQHADPNLYGDLASKVRDVGRGPEYDFTRLRKEEFRSLGLMVKQT